MSAVRGLLEPYYSAPPARTPAHDRPTLLVTYWCTVLCVVIVLFRTVGRLVRVSKLYSDDKLMLLTIIPLLVRQALVHLVLLYGTNNVLGTADMGEEELRRRRIGSRMVLGARVMYTICIWLQKFCITEFYVRLTVHFWKRSYEVGLRIIRWSLLASFVGAVMSVFLECRPGKKLWQVHPDPGPHCRSSFAPLLTISSFSIITDAMLILSPIPAIMQSSFTALKKVRIILTTFSLSVFCIAFAGYRVPAVILAHGNQQLRTLLASFELLTATIVSNAIIINSFARGKGERKRRFSDESNSHINRESVSEASAAVTRYRSSDGDGGGGDGDLARTAGVDRVPEAEKAPVGEDGDEDDMDDADDNDDDADEEETYHSYMQQQSRIPRAVLRGAALSPADREIWETKGRATPSAASQPVLFDIGGLLEEGRGGGEGGGSDGGSSDGAVFSSSSSLSSSSSSSLGLWDIVDSSRS